MFDEDREFLEEVKKEVNKTINEVADRLGIDRAYYEFTLKCNILGEDFCKVNEETLIDENCGRFCNFCGKPTRYYDQKRHYYICAKCLGELERDANDL